MIKAFVFGKFLPFHKGHEALIRFALTHCDFLTVLICCSDKELILSSEREQWIKKTFENEQKIIVQIFTYSEDELPNTSVASETVSESWSCVFSQLVPHHSLLITSETYGSYVAKYMGIGHIFFDRERIKFPVSATAIRTDIFTNWIFLPESVKPYFAIRVVLLGTESTGKTTLTRQLSKHYNCSQVLETAREIIPDSNSFCFEDLLPIAEEHTKRIASAIQGDSPLIVIDTDIHITMSYSRFVLKKELILNDNLYNVNKANLYLYLCKDAEYIQDGTRLKKSDRDLLDSSHRKILEENNVSFIEINGNWEQRFDNAVKCIDKLLSSLYPSLE